MSGLLLGMVLSVCTCFFHSMVIIIIIVVIIIIIIIILIIWWLMNNSDMARYICIYDWFQNTAEVF
jgi:hypothetical protein